MQTEGPSLAIYLLYWLMGKGLESTDVTKAWGKAETLFPTYRSAKIKDAKYMEAAHAFNTHAFKTGVVF